MVKGIATKPCEKSWSSMTESRLYCTLGVRKLTEWQSVAVIAVSILIAIFSQRLWLPSLLNTLKGKRIDGIWADKKFSLTVLQAEKVIDQQQSALLDDQWGPVSYLKSIPGVSGNLRMTGDRPVNASPSL